jgi:hypothetical protein
MRKPAKYFIASVLAGFTLVCLTASATAEEQNDWPASKRVECSNPAAAV